MKFNFVKSRKIFFAIALIMVVATVVSYFTMGLNLDIEFVGGTELTFQLDNKVQKADEDAIKNAVIEVVGKDDFSSLRIVGDNKDQVVVRTKIVDKDTDFAAINASIDEAVLALYPEASVVSATEGKVVYSIPVEEHQETEETEEAHEHEVDLNAVKLAVEPLVYSVDVTANEENGNVEVEYEPISHVSELRAEIANAVNTLYPLAETAEQQTRLISTDTVSAEVSSTLKKSAVGATALAILLMLIYIAFRFEVSSAFAAIVCLAHDVLVMILAYMVFQIPVGSTIIAAILTIVGYSINATIVVFDRLRENMKKFPGASLEEKVDSSIKTTFWRSINTTITTLLTIGLVYILGVTSIKNFALPLIVGIVSGAFSSICLAGNLHFVFKNKKK